MNMLTIGADPELFVRKGDIYISGHTFPCGTKEQPVPTTHGSVQVDGLALEFNVRPAAQRIDFISNVRAVQQDLTDLVKSIDPECNLAAIPTVIFGMDYINGLPADVRQLGCHPDFNAYTGEPNPRPNAERPFRTGAGHVHMGFTQCDPITYEHFQMCCTLVRELDFYLGVSSLDWDNDAQRRQLYGKAGAFRPKTYGLEYRVLSNAWVDDVVLIGRVFDLTKRAYDNFTSGNLLYAKHGDTAKHIIDNNLTNWRQTFKKLAEELV